jgi:hypothetical protein
LVGIVDKWIMMFDDGEYDIRKFEKFKTRVEVLIVERTMYK